MPSPTLEQRQIGPSLDRFAHLMSLRALAEKQLGSPLDRFDPVFGEEYIAELRALLAHYPHDVHFMIERGDGNVLYLICLEDGCEGTPPFAVSTRLSTEPSLNAFKEHIDTHPTHSVMRNVRLQTPTTTRVEAGSTSTAGLAGTSTGTSHKREYSAVHAPRQSSGFSLGAAVSGLTGYLSASFRGNSGQPVDSRPIKKQKTLPGLTSNRVFATQGDGPSRVVGIQDVEDPLQRARETLRLRDDLIPGMRTALLPHQVIGVAWMLRQEQGRFRGGCLADEMGLGKTMQTIAVTMVNPPQGPAQTKTTLVIAPLGLLRQWEDEIIDKTGGQLKVLIYHGKSKLNSVQGITAYDFVLVTLSTLITEWCDPQEEERSGSTGKGKGKGKQVSRSNTLFEVSWLRVVIDEAHMSTKSSRAVTTLRATYRWALTGTPIVNSLQDAYGILRFLQVPSWGEWPYFNALIAKLERQDPRLATRRLNMVYSTIQLRRLTTSMLNGKRLVDIPPRSVEVKRLDFNQEERELYQTIELRQQIVFNKFLRAGTILKNYQHILTMLLRLRQLCLHMDLIQDSQTSLPAAADDDDARQNSLERSRAEKLVGAVFVDKVKDQRIEIARQNAAVAEEESDEVDTLGMAVEECAICLDAPIDAIVTECGHVFCRPCIMAVFASQERADAGASSDVGAHNCPNCRNFITTEKLFSLSAFEPASTVGGDLSQIKPSSKLQYMLETISGWNKDYPDEKILVISQWTSCLNLISVCLTEHDVAHVQYRGDMTLDQRQRAIEAFQGATGHRVMLMSRACGGVGLNLTRGNRVICMDLAWSEAVENQAWSRVHRIGQQRNVHIERIIIRDTIEERLLAMQARKRMLAETSLADGIGIELETGFTELELATLFNVKA